MNFRLARDQVVLLETAAGVKQTISSQFFSTFEFGGKTKHLMTGPIGNSEFCFSETLNVSRGKAEGNIEVEGVLIVRRILGSGLWAAFSPR